MDSSRRRDRRARWMSLFVRSIEDRQAYAIPSDKITGLLALCVPRDRYVFSFYGTRWMVELYHGLIHVSPTTQGVTRRHKRHLHGRRIGLAHYLRTVRFLTAV